ncbi:uncharacterized protein BX663DRAFT_504838 [Cokeromyces recurvatus]|uniref:uncharacterized protein n=1 Tax=Cokeromyces recurvatus TaxID=90255 RepID=UPI00222031FA|nr:uncharacterized protein BX663DRAFT_504838 [Cokeromyces recurvatus]KAI7904372.1 hypothetical protein BX663DRAFT_504838 [Cokeromyces recurvatus]
MTYLSGGKTIDGVKVGSPIVNNQSIEDDISYTYLPDSTTYPSLPINVNQIAINFRRLGISTEDLDDRLLSLYSNTKLNRPVSITLDASRNQLTNIPDSISRFKRLTQLNLSCNQITIISPIIYLHLRQLKQLHLSENKIEIIPDEMPFYLTQLEVLKLDNNCIKTLPESIGEWKKMREFQLGSEYGGNLIKYLPDSISHMHSLIELDVSFNNLNSLLPTTFNELKQLRHLNLSYNRIQSLPDTSTIFSRCNELIMLDLSHNQLSILPLRIVDELVRLTKDNHLRLINLSYNYFDLLPNVLLAQTELQVIIKGNPFGAYYEIASHLLHHSTDKNRQRLLPSTSTLSNHFDSLSARLYTNEYLIERLFSKDKEDVTLIKKNQNTSATTLSFIPSLREIAIRNLLKEIERDNSIDSISYKIPDHINSDIHGIRHYCYHCKQPFVYEWINEILLKSYRSNPSVPQQIALCSIPCWNSYQYFVEHQVLTSENHIISSRQDIHHNEALEFIIQHGGVLEPSSFAWVEAAARAAQQQAQDLEYFINMPPS